MAGSPGGQGAGRTSGPDWGAGIAGIPSGPPPPGYTWDQVQGKYVKTVESAPRQLATADKSQTNQDALYAQMLASLNGAGGSSGVGAGYTGGGSAGIPARVGAGGGTSGGTGGGGTGAGGGAYSTVTPVDTRAAESAAFGRAKDQVGETSQGALSGLRSALGGRGMLGSGAEYRGTANVFNKGQQQLGDVSRGLAIKGAENAQENAQTNYAGGLTQRGQNMNDAQTALSAQVAQRGQDIGAQSSANALQAQIAQANAQARQSTLNGLLSALSKGSSY